MPVIFSESWNRLPTVIAVGAAAIGALVVGAVTYWFSPNFTDVGYEPVQPVPFSHRLHAGEMGLDCRYCHNTVEYAAHAAIPPTATCMNCHAQVKADSPLLELVRQSAASGKPIEWVRVHMLPDYAFFDHSVHLAAGVGCSSCHGRIDEMEVVRQEKSLSMGWCLECHRDPHVHMRPRDRDLITKMDWTLGSEGCDPATDVRRGCEVEPPEHCGGCHR